MKSKSGFKPKNKYKSKAYAKRKPATRNLVRSLVKKELNKNIETKRACQTSADGSEVGHNAGLIVDSTILATTQGVTDPNNNNLNCRVGDEINLKGVEFQMMLELNERYSHITYKIFVIKAAKGDVPTNTTLFCGLSGNKMLDKLNTERFKIIVSKTGTMKAGNFGGQTASSGTLLGGGLFDVGGTNVNLYSRQTKIVKIYVPGGKFAPGGKLKYENGAQQPVFYDYFLYLYAYSNYSTSDLLGFNVLRLNDYVKTMYYRDA